MFQRLTPFIPFVIPAFFFVVFSHYFYQQVGDDSFIYYRYVERALDGKWWSWTDQLAAVEGFSSPLWYFLLVATTSIGYSVDVEAQLLGFACSVAVFLLSIIFAKRIGLNNRQAALAVSLLVLNTGFHYWSTAGLETSLYMFVFLWAVIAMMQCRSWVFPVALIGILRPEGPILLAALLLAMKFTYKDRVSFLQLFIATLPALLWLGVRLTIYELPLPNTFYAKASGGSVKQIFKGLFYCLPVLLPLLWCWWQWQRERIESEKVALGAVTMLLGIVFFGGGDWMFHFRLLLPVLTIVIGISLFYFFKQGRLQRLFLVVLSAPLLLLSVPPVHVLKALQFDQLDQSFYQEGYLTEASMGLAGDIKQSYPKGSLIAVNHAGALPFVLPEYNFIDMVGLNDAHIAQSEGDVHEKFDVDYVLNSQPDLIVLNSRIKPGSDDVYYHKGYWVGEDALVDHPLFQANYEPANLEASWHWQLPFPYSLFVREYTSWIIVYKKIQ